MIHQVEKQSLRLRVINTLGLRDKLREVVRIKESPQRIALAFAVGVFLGMSPLVGLHTIMGIAAAYAFRFNKFVTMVGVYVTNPWTIVPIYTFTTWLGARLLGIDQVLPDIDWNKLTFSSFFTEMQHLLWPFFFGTTLVSIISAVAGYFLIFHAVVRSRR